MRAPAWKRIAAKLTVLKHLLMTVFIFVLPVAYILPVGASGFEKEGSCPTACDVAPMLVRGIRSFQDKRPRWVGPRETALASLSQQAPGHVPNTSQWRQHRSDAKFQSSAKGASRSQQCRTIRHGQSPGGRLPFADGANAHPSVHKRMTGKKMLDVFGGPGFLAKASNHLGLRGLCARHVVWSQE